VNTPGLSIFLRKGGSDRNEEQPFFRSDALFSKVFKVSEVMRSLYYPNELVKWESNTKVCEFLSLDGCHGHGLAYCATKKVFTISGRDFLDKSFLFHSGDTVYKYSSSVDNCSSLRPPPSGTVRGQSIYSFAIARRDASDNKIHFTNIN
jgi:hypothetical protein